MTIILSACGGGGSSDSSYSGTKKFGSTTFQCSSQSAFDSCTSASNCSQCTCTSGCATNEPVITTQCAVSNNQMTATTAGCIGTAGGTQTFVCSAGSLYALSGTNHNATSVKSNGAKFSSGLTLNGITIKCAA